MHPVRKQRLVIVSFIVITASAASALIFWALGQNLNFFYAPTAVLAGEAPENRTIRVGGLVVPGSVQRAGEGLEVSFRVTDNAADIEVLFQGILPDLFEEGQGVVAIGELIGPGRVRANQVLAKHDENYMPPEVEESLKEVHSMPQQAYQP
jgi:cytochrome c-type biogenesis protein CcmE